MLTRLPIKSRLPAGWSAKVISRADGRIRRFLLPDGAPVRLLDRATLWNEVGRETQGRSLRVRKDCLNQARDTYYSNNPSFSQ